MKRLIAACSIIIARASCTGSSSQNGGIADSNATASDTIMGTTNPGVGFVADDTTGFWHKP